VTAFKVRRACPEDADGILRLFETVAAERRYILSEPPIDRELRRQRFIDGLQSDEATHFVAEAEGDVVGELAVHHRGTGPATIGMGVGAAWRGRGVGTALMQACVEWARAKGVHKLSLEVFPWNEAAISLYRKFGFVEEGRLRSHYRRQSGELWDVLVMGLVLGPQVRFGILSA
jgi:RimJ/RimL family protein N-acetyltransferase